MKPTQAIAAITTPMLKESVPDFGVGDTVRVSVKVVEGSRERIQIFEGVVMRRRGGGINANFTVRRIASHGIGVERTFLLNSPRVDKIEVMRRGVVRRAQLYYLRGRTGKAARIKERRFRPGDRLSAKTASTNGTAALVAPEAEEVITFAPAALELDDTDTTPSDSDSDAVEVPGPEASDTAGTDSTGSELPAEQAEEPTKA